MKRVVGSGAPIWQRIGWQPKQGDPLTRNLLLAAAALALVLIVALLGYGIFLLRGSGQAGEISATSGPLSDVVESNGTTATVPAPSGLTIAQRTWTIYPIIPQGNEWRYARNQPDKAAWVRGTLVNTVIGLPPSPDNETAIRSLKPGDDVVLAKSDDSQLHFVVRSISQGVTDAELFDQHHPGLTLVTLDDDSQKRLVIRADYQSNQESPPPAGGNVPGTVGAPVRSGPAELVVLAAEVRTGSPAPDGNGYLQIDYQIDNRGNVPLTALNFRFDLIDGQNLQFAPSPSAAQGGHYPPITGTIDPGATVTGTVGYEITLPVVPPYKLSFRPTAESEPPAVVVLPIQPQVTPTPPASAPSVHVQINGAVLSPDGSTLTITGRVENTDSNQTMAIQASDIQLAAPGGTVIPLQLSDPPLPWKLAPSQSQAFTLTFARPNSASAILTIRTNSFQLTGLH